MLGESDENTIVNKKLNFPKHFFQFYVIYKNIVLVAESFRVSNWRSRSLCVSRIYTANQWIDVYHAHFTEERKLYVKTGHIYKVIAKNLLIDLGTRGGYYIV